MANVIVLLSDKGSFREVEIETLPRNVRAAITNLTTKTPQTSVTVDQLGALYRIRLSAPANVCLDVLAVA
jgi:hypothetical protein